jgi:hypothetical protein
MLAIVHVLAPPVGSVEVRTFPAPSAATHSETDGHETAVRYPAGSIWVLGHALAPAVGLVEVNRFPWSVAATQSKTEGHDTPSRVSTSEEIDAVVHELAPPVGSVDVAMVGRSPLGPPSPAATHSDTDGHEIAPR